MKWKKLIVFIMVFAAVYGFVTVDAAYSDMLDQEGKIVPSIRRVNTQYVVVSMMGKSASIDIKRLGEDWHEFSNNVVDNLDAAVKNIRETLGIEKEKINYDSFQVHLL